MTTLYMQEFLFSNFKDHARVKTVRVWHYITCI